MSRFRTSIPVAVQEILGSLPKDSFVHNQHYDKTKQELVVEWEHENYPTGYTFPVEYPLADLRLKRLPKAVKDQRRVKSLPKPENVPTAIVERNQAIPVDAPDYVWSKEKLESEVKGNAAIEYQGVESRWKALEADHIWRAGYFYRKCVNSTPTNHDNVLDSLAAVT